MFAYTDEPICACSTPAGISGLAVIRISGTGCGVLTDKCTKILRSSGDYDRVSLLPGYTCAYGTVIDPKTGETIDKTIITRLAVLVKNGFIVPHIVNERIRSYELSDFARNNKNEIINAIQ